MDWRCCFITDTIQTMSPDELYHYGVMGMKWGIRRYQNPDGSLTAEGKRKYGKESDNKSEYRTELEKEYRKTGMTKQHARMAADQSIKINKVLLGMASVTVAAAAGYALRKNVKARADLIIKSGKTIQVIANEADKNLDRAFYAAFKNTDKLKYKGMFGGLQLRMGGSDVFDIKLDTLKDVKIASRNKSAEAFVDLYRNDPDFKKHVDNSMPIGNAGGLRGLKDFDKMTDRQLKKFGYGKFNQRLVNHLDGNISVAGKQFYKRMQDMGYDGILDINDMDYSGYNAKAPVILFEKGDKIKVSSVDELSKKELNKKAVEAVGYNLAENHALDSMRKPGAMVFNAGWATKIATDKQQQTQVRSLHASGMSNAEIAKRLEMSPSEVSKILNKK